LFREDLFHRLNVIRLRLPPLRERREDIPLLAKYFLKKSASELSVEQKQFSDATLQHLKAQDFPGNVRQLENLCHWLTVMTPSQMSRSPIFRRSGVKSPLRVWQLAATGVRLWRNKRR